MKRSPLAGFVAMALAGYLLLSDGEFTLPTLPNIGGVTVPDADLAEPTGELAKAVQPLIGAVENLQVRAELSALYACMADSIERDTENVTTTDIVRKLNARTGQMYYEKWERSLKAEAPGIGAEINAAVEAGMGSKKNEPLDAATRAKVVAVYRAIAWAFLQ